MAIKERYQASFEYWADANDGGWQDWFNPGIPSDLAYPAETEFAVDVVAEMLEAGEALWNHPGWLRDLWELLEDWAMDGQLIRVRLFAQSLLLTMPESPLDKELGDRLTLLANGEFCEVFAGKKTDWLHTEEFYLHTLQWGIVPYVVEWMRNMGIR